VAKTDWGGGGLKERRLTNSNCSGADEPRLRATKNRSRACALGAVFLRHIFLCAGIASQFLHRAQKTSVALLLNGIILARTLVVAGGIRAAGIFRLMLRYIFGFL
jgi:hypothetical protein